MVSSTEEIKKVNNKYLSKILWHERRLTFKGKRITKLSKNPRKDKCEWCGKGKGDEYIDSRGRLKLIKNLHLHHEKYHDNDPLKDTFTLCPPCHQTETQRIKKLKEGIRKCSICAVTNTTIQVKRYKSGKEYVVQRWMRNPINKKDWLCFHCYNKIRWRLSKL